MALESITELNSYSFILHFFFFVCLCLCLNPCICCCICLPQLYYDFHFPKLRHYLTQNLYPLKLQTSTRIAWSMRGGSPFPVSILVPPAKTIPAQSSNPQEQCEPQFWSLLWESQIRFYIETSDLWRCTSWWPRCLVFQTQTSQIYVILYHINQELPSMVAVYIGDNSFKSLFQDKPGSIDSHYVWTRNKCIGLYMLIPIRV